MKISVVFYLILACLLIHGENSKALTVTQVDPAAGALSADSTALITVTFDEAIDVGSLTDEAFAVYASYRGRMYGSLTWNAATQAIEFQSAEAFLPAEEVTCIVTRSLVNSGGDTLASAYSWSFRIATRQDEFAFAPAELLEATLPFNVSSLPPLVDLDLDGDLDAVTIGQGGLQLWENNGAGELIPPLTGFADASGFVLSISDINSDSYGDFLVGSGDYSIILSDGAGGFLPENTVFDSVGNAEAMCDVDLDGCLDILLAVDYDSSLHLLRGDCSGGFSDTIACEFDRVVNALVVEDLDLDGHPDLIAKSTADSLLIMFANNGNGGFDITDSLSSGYVTSIIAEDLNSDGVPELLLGYSDHFQLLERDSGLSYSMLDSIGADTTMRLRTVSDLDGDGDLDLIAATPTYMLTFENDGSASFSAVTGPATRKSAWNVTIGDLDEDGRPDIVSTGGHRFLQLFRNHWSLVSSHESILVNVLADVKGATSRWVELTTNREDVGYTVSDDAEWLEVAPASGTTPESLLVTASSNGLPLGTYEATIQITPDDTACYAISIDVQMEIINHPISVLAAGHVNDSIEFAIGNIGTVGSLELFGSGAQVDHFTGDELMKLEYPRHSGVDYLFLGALWIGGVVGEDTLVATGTDGWLNESEFYPDPVASLSKMDSGGVLEYTAIYSDTATFLEDSTYKPLNIEVTQRSMSWSQPGAEKMVFVSYNIANIGIEQISDAYVGQFMDADCRHVSNEYAGAQDDITGFMYTWEVDLGSGCTYTDTINLAWAADNDGDLDDTYPVPHVAGTMFLGVPASSAHVSYNWWVSNTLPSLDFGPREQAFAGVWLDDYRDFGTGGTGTPEGDENKYYQLRNQEIDYNLYRTGVIGDGDPLWRQPYEQLETGWEDQAASTADGTDTRYLLSVGPFDLAPGESETVVLAVVVGDNLHSVAGNLLNLPADPATYEANLDFSGIAASARTAAATYDIPGFDTDGDGDFGEFVLCGVDTVWVKGDGVPDWQPSSIQCCQGIRGNVDGDSNEAINIADMTVLIAYLFSDGPTPECPEEADSNADQAINIADMTYLIAFLFSGGPAPAMCQ